MTREEAKETLWNYIASLPLDSGQKLMLRQLSIEYAHTSAMEVANSIKKILADVKLLPVFEL